jgi:arylsulfatase A-like enzyme
LGWLVFACPVFSKKPNLLLVLVDDLGWKDLGCYGADIYRTPHIDGLAADGMRFTNGYAACAVCSPSRASVVTGQYPSRIGITDWIRARFQGGEGAEDTPFERGWTGPNKQGVDCPKNPFFLPREYTTLAELLQGAGYTTCYVGKWHLGFDPYYPEHQGYDFNYGGCDFGQPPSYFDPFSNEKLPQGIHKLPGRREGEYLTDREADEASGFIRQHKDVPFFLQMSTYTVHTPIRAKEEVVKKYQGTRSPVYAAMVESLDDAVGKVLNTLEELGLKEKTIVVFTSDNGGVDLPNFATECAPLRAGKGHPYEGGIRVPLIVRWPGVTVPGTVTDEPAIGPDFYPTLAGAAGVEIPAGQVVDGKDLRPLLAGGMLEKRDLLWHYPHYRSEKIPPYSIVRSGKWKLLKRYGAMQEFELYDLQEDLSEEQDLAGSMPEKVAELNRILVGLLEETGSKVPRVSR